MVENAVKHGLSGKEAGGSIRIHARPVNGHLQIEVKDNGVGMPENTIAAVFRKNAADPVNTNIGLRNVNQRLEQIYGPCACLQIRSRPQEGTSIIMNLPNTAIQVI